MEINDHSPLGFLVALLLAGVATIIGEVDSWFRTPDLGTWLHLALQASKGLCYLGSAGVGIVTILKFFRKNGHK